MTVEALTAESHPSIVASVNWKSIMSLSNAPLRSALMSARVNVVFSIDLVDSSLPPSDKHLRAQPAMASKLAGVAASDRAVVTEGGALRPVFKIPIARSLNAPSKFAPASGIYRSRGPVGLSFALH